jgi:transposase
MATARGRYKSHSPAFKRAVVEETLLPGASVSRIAREHGVNANQVFLWRKQFREGVLPESQSQLLPVTFEPLVVSNKTHKAADKPEARLRQIPHARGILAPLFHLETVS